MLVGTGVLFLSAPFWPPIWAHWRQVQLHHSSVQLFRQASKSLPKTELAVPAPSTPSPKSGAVVAVLSISRLNLNASVVAGTSDSELASAPGWVNTTVLPGQNGTSVIAAHNATFFRHLNRLTAGTLIGVTTSQGAFLFQVQQHTIVKSGSPIVNTISPSLALEACYPLNALYLTPWRYVVTAKLISSRLDRMTLPHPKTLWPFQAAIPTGISRRWPLWLSQNNLPMGTLTYLGPHTAATRKFEQSRLPFDIVAESLRLFFAARDVAAVKDLAGWRAIASPDTPLPPFWGKELKTLGHANVVVQIDANGNPKSVQINLTHSHWQGVAPHTIQFDVRFNHLLMYIAGFQSHLPHST